jgi:hypothetical protein
VDKTLKTLFGYVPQPRAMVALVAATVACAWLAFTAPTLLGVAAVFTFIFTQAAFFANRPARVEAGLGVAVVLAVIGFFA